MVSKLLQSGLVWHAHSRLVHTTTPAASFGLPEIDKQLPEHGLCLGAVHEWCLEQDLSFHRKAFWSAPLILLSSVIAHNLRSGALSSRKSIAWIGRRCWPTPALMNSVFDQDPEFNWRSSCLFLQPATSAQFLWTACEVLRSPCIGAAVIDGSSFNQTAARRLQLYARESSVLGLIVRQPWKIAAPSPARTKWKVTTSASPSSRPRWKIELLRCRGAPADSSWLIEYDPERKTKAIEAHRENLYLYLPTDMVDRPDSAQICAA